MADINRATDIDIGSRVTVRRVDSEDLPQIVSIDEGVTGSAKPEYWQDIFERYATRRRNERFFLVAEAAGDAERKTVVGYMIGEVRTWEFGSEPCGWIFAFAVDASCREQGIGQALFEAISDRFREIGISTLRTMVLRQNQLPMQFFRSEGMVAGPYIQLEKDLDD